jgi:[2Fe-2S] binding domain
LTGYDVPEPTGDANEKALQGRSQTDQGAASKPEERTEHVEAQSQELTKLNQQLEQRNPDRDTIRLRLNDNICRCTGYEDIVSSVERAVALMCGEKPVR